MSEEIVYIDYDEALTVYGKMIDASDGGFEGVRDEGGIRATLDFVQNDLYYPTFAEKLTYLMYRFCSGHFFNDGNKRIALTLGAYFLHKNNYYWHACICMRTLESIIYHVAASNINQDLLLRIVNSFLTSKDYDEELKIDIANAMSKGELGIQGEDYEIVLAIIEILRIFAFNRAFFGLMQNKKKYRNLLVSISLPINLKAFVIPLFPMSNKI